MSLGYKVQDIPNDQCEHTLVNARCTLTKGHSGQHNPHLRLRINDWQPIETAPNNEIVWTKIDDTRGPRNEIKLIRQGRLWFFEDKSMYVYYDPTHWRKV